jgi:acyl-CoA synthetase (AMP-forming)/AMP-acid ligase II
MRIDHIIDYHARQRPDNVALSQIDGSQEQTLSYSEMNAKAQLIANGFSAAGVTVSDRIAVICENCIEEIIIFLAAAKIGAVTVPLNYRLAGPELEFIINDCEAKVVVVPDSKLCDLIDRLHLSAETILIGEADSLPSHWLQWSKWIAEQSIEKSSHCDSYCETEADDAFAQLYTSGTTGKPKGAIISHRNLIDLSMAGVIAAEERSSIGDNELIIAPLFHVGAVASLFHSLMMGVNVIVHRNFNPHAVVDAIEKHQLKILFMVPAMIQAILTAVPSLDQRDFRSLKRINYGAAPIDEGLLKKALSVFDCNFQQSYGMTESGNVSQLTVADHRKALDGQPELLSSCGRENAASQIRIVDEQGKEVLDGELGEITVKSTLNMLGYWHLPEQTAGTIKGGWLYTGDIGVRDNEGYIFLKDRKKDMVISGGENIYPNEVERVLLKHESINDVAIIGIPDDKFGEALLACCIMVEGQVLNNEELITFCREYLAGYKVPRQYTALQELPRNMSGKVLKKKLREPYWKK